MRTNILHVDPTKFKTINRLLYACCRGCENEYTSSYSTELDRINKCTLCSDKLETAYKDRIPFIFKRKTCEIIKEIPD